MANLDIAQTLVKFLAQNPSLITQFLAHPYSTVDQATGADEHLSKKDMSEVVTAAAAMSTGQNVDMSNLAGVASTLLAQNGGSVHALTNALFGTPQQAVQIQQQQQAASGAQSSGLDLGTLVGLAGALMGTGAAVSAAKKKKTGADLVDLSDGFDVKDVIGLASLFLANKQ